MFQVVANVSDELVEITGQATANVEVIDSTIGRPFIGTLIL